LLKRYALFLTIVTALAYSCSNLPQLQNQDKHALPSKPENKLDLNAADTATPEERKLSNASSTASSISERNDQDMTPLRKFETLKITILYDNNSHDQRLKTAWGFSALVECGPSRILFDTGGDSQTLLGNMNILGVDSYSIDSVFLSHAHNDHVGGLDGFLESADQPTVYLLPSFSERFKQHLSKNLNIVEVTSGLSPQTGITSTGEMSGDIPEQSLLIHTDQGLVVITGCAHPGIVDIIEMARELTGEQIYLVLGGFHLKDTPRAGIESIIANFRRLGVEKVAPTHCTGAQAITLFEQAYDADFIPAGAGLVIQIGD
jgi:7,8-dihydropterin-6-yl-methyl-4-(beta-D-ribofuranosyl)aminobenzene 5'-phosphate synthase